jgi:hypothetical protein
MTFTITIQMVLIASLVLNYLLIGAIIIAVEDKSARWPFWVMLMILWPLPVIMFLMESVNRAFKEL